MNAQDTHFSFSGEDLRILEDTSFFTKKRNLTDRINGKLLQLEQLLRDDPGTARFPFPTEVRTAHGKISKGENYMGLPWMLLDYPSGFSRESVFAFRTLFWWGHPFSMTLVLKGSPFKQFGIPLARKLAELDSTLLCCINNSPWVHHFQADNYITVDALRASGMDFEKHSAEKGFLKIACTHPLQEMENLDASCIRFYRDMLIRMGG